MINFDQIMINFDQIWSHDKQSATKPADTDPLSQLAGAVWLFFLINY